MQFCAQPRPDAVKANAGRSRLEAEGLSGVDDREALDAREHKECAVGGGEAAQRHGQAIASLEGLGVRPLDWLAARCGPQQTLVAHCRPVDIARDVHGRHQEPGQDGATNRRDGPPAAPELEEGGSGHVLRIVEVADESKRATEDPVSVQVER